jgi:hypothetical protein
MHTFFAYGLGLIPEKAKSLLFLFLFFKVSILAQEPPELPIQ